MGKCWMFVSGVHPVAIMSAVFCVYVVCLCLILVVSISWERTRVWFWFCIWRVMFPFVSPMLVM